MSESTLIASGSKLTREELALVPTPAGTATHKPIPHVEVVNELIETLGFRQIAVHRGEHAVSKDGMKMFGIMELETQFASCRFAIGIRNAHDKSMRLAMTVGYRVTFLHSPATTCWEGGMRCLTSYSTMTAFEPAFCCSTIAL